jgi:hypothetical protein
MVYLTDSRPRVKLLKATRRHFQAHGWEVEEQSHPHVDLRVTKRDLRFFVRCLDETVRLYASSLAIIKDVESVARQVRARNGRSLVTVFDSGFHDLDLGTLVSREAFAILIRDLHVVTSLDRYLDELPNELSPGQSFLLKRDVWVCLVIADRYRKSGDDTQAVDWARYGVEASTGFTDAYMTLFRLLKDRGDLIGAEKIALAALALQPYDCEVLREMKHLSAERGDREAAARWAQRLERELAVPRDFADIIKNQKRNAQASSANVEGERPWPKPSRFGRIFAGLFRSA